MNIKKYMKDHEAYLKEQLSNTDTTSINDLKNKHERVIRYMQHERFIHLLVTFAFAFFFLLTFVIALIKPYPSLFILMGLFFILLVPYILHYFFLENTIQRWYQYMDEIEKKS